jgi:replicative DNA helicase
MHKDTRSDYNKFLQNLTIGNCNKEAEYKLAHTLLCGSNDQIADICGNMEEGDFYDLGCLNIFNTVKEDFLAGGNNSGYEQFKHITVKYAERFEGKNLKLDVNYVGSLMEFFDTDSVPDDEEVKLLMKAVKQKTDLRRTVHSLYKAVDMCAHEDNGVEKAHEYIRAISSDYDAQRNNDAVISKQEFAEGMLSLAYEYNDPEKRRAKTINMPWKSFQYSVGGFSAGELVIISAKSGQGKSAFSLCVGIEAGVVQKIPTLYINSELSKEQLIARYLSNAAYIDSRKFVEGRYRDENAEGKMFQPVANAIMLAGEKYYRGALEFATIPDLQLSNIETTIRNSCREKGTRLVIVDYLGRMDITKTSGVKDLQEWQIMRLAANRLKTLAQKYNVCVIMVAQLTDDGGLQGSKAMKNEADMWLSINRLKQPDDTYHGKRLIDIFPYNTFVTIEKARNVNDVAFVRFRYEGAMMRFCDSLADIKAMVDRNRQYGEYANELMTPDEYHDLCVFMNNPERY